MLYLDIETDGLDPTVIHCVGYAIDDGAVRIVTDGDRFRDILATIPDRTVCAHNGFGFDYRHLSRLWGIDWTGWDCQDTIVMSRLLEPDRKGGHGLAAWGERLSYPKSTHSDWATFTPEMAKYCRIDVEVLRCLYKALRGPLRDFSDSLGAEYRVAAKAAQMTADGFLLDLGAAEALWVSLTQRMNKIEQTLQATFPPIVTPRVSEKTGKTLQDDVEVFNVGSRQQIAKRLSSIGAVFTETTETGQAVVNEKTLAAINLPEAALVLEYLTHQKHTGLIDSWINAVGGDGRVHGSVNTIGAVTGRMSHSKPNMAQVPSDERFRRLWTVPEDHVLVGIDASGLELRMLAHHMDDPDYTAMLLDGDIHTHNQTLAGLGTRAQAKTFIYAFLYGAGDGKIGEIVGGSAAAGKRLRQQFLDGLPALTALLKRVSREAKRGYVVGLDGRHINIRHDHAALNTLLQGDGAIVMKWWWIEFAERLERARIPHKFVANVHDEVQVEVPEYYGTPVGKIGLRCFGYVTEQLNLRCPLAGEVKTGSTWAETH